MKRMWLVVIMVVSMAAFTAPREVSAEVSDIALLGDCTHAVLHATFAGANGAAQNALITVMAGSEKVDARYVDIPAGNSVDATMAWDEVPRGTRITVAVVHYIQGQGEVDYASRSYECGDPVTGGPVMIFAPETNDRVVITTSMPVYGAADYQQAIAGTLVEAGQEFLMVDVVVVDGVPWYQIFIGGSYPWVPGSGAYTYSVAP